MQQNLIQNKDSFPDTHYFVYKSKQYPIKYGFFKLSSKYFAKNSAIIKQNKEVQLVDEELEQNVNLTEQSIIDFIKYVHHEPIMLTNDNVIGINYLSKKYEVSSLLELTTNYISLHHDNLAIEIFSIYQTDPSFSTEKYENIISDHFLSYIQDDRLLSLPISTLYRIFSIFQEKEKKSAKNNEQIFEFLLKCLDKYGKNASVLFSCFDFENSPRDFLNLLSTKYSKIFDFHFINADVIKGIYQQQNDMILNEINNGNKQVEFQNLMKMEIDKIREEFKRELELQKKNEDENLMKTKDEINLIKNEFEKKLAKQKEEYEKEINDLKGGIKEQKEEYEKEINDLKGGIKKQKEEYEKEINDLKGGIKKQKEEYVKEINDLKGGIKEQKDKVSNKVEEKDKQSFLYDGDIQNQFNGIINHLTKKCGGNVHEKGVVNVTSSSGDNSKDAVDLENVQSYFQTKGAASKPNHWLKYDFKNKKIRPTHYTIRSRPDGEKGYFNPKTWVIEASNTDRDNDWKILDSQNEVYYLDGPSLSHTFQIQQSNEFYRFLRFRQTGRNTGRDYNIRLSALEYFGFISKV